jgi:hypothetical protein
MPRVGFESMIPVFERAKRAHALDRAATVISLDAIKWTKIINLSFSSVTSVGCISRLVEVKRYRMKLTSLFTLFSQYKPVPNLSVYNLTVSDT